MSATDFRRIITASDDIAIECSNGRTVTITVYGDGFASLGVDELRALHLALGDALDLIETRHAGT